jgi:hypothetical protein
MAEGYYTTPVPFKQRRSIVVLPNENVTGMPAPCILLSATPVDLWSHSCVGVDYNALVEAEAGVYAP